MSVGFVTDHAYAAALRDPFLTITLASSGAEITLDGTEFRLLDGVQGLGVAPVDTTRSDLSTGGSVARHSRFGEAQLMLPIKLKAPSPAGLYRLRRRLEQVLLPETPGNLTPIEIRVETAHNGTIRSRFGLYESGLDYTLGGSDSHFTWQKLALTILCPDPWWYGEEHVIETKVGSARKPFLQRVAGSAPADVVPFFPIILAPSTVAGGYEIEIAGDGPAFPVWTVTGPGTDLLLRNQSTGERIFLSGDITEPVTIDTRPQVQDVSSPSASMGQLWDRVSTDSVLFSLSPGVNRVVMEMVNATPASSVRLSYRERWKAGH